MSAVTCRCSYCEGVIYRKWEGSHYTMPPRWSDFCSDECHRLWGMAYDRYVDPLGFYRAKATDPYE